MTGKEVMRNILITGATGIIGGAVARHLAAVAEFQVRVAVRRVDHGLPQSVQQFAECTLAGGEAAAAAWDAALADVDCVIHCAARVHQMHDKAADPAAEFQKINTHATLELAERAVQAGVRRFIFLSSIMVNGVATLPGKPFAPEDPPHPQSAYAQSKWDAEVGLKAIAERTGLELVILRPPMVIASNAKGNFLTLANIVAKGVPLPFGAVRNQRSVVGIDNLVSLMALCVTHPQAAQQTLFVSDGQDVLIADLIRLMASAMGKKARLIPIPPSLMAWAATLLGRKDLAQRLLGSLQVDIANTRARLGWTPPVPLAEGIRRALQG